MQRKKNMQQTAGEMFYYRLSSALEAQDLAILETLYHPDATLISLRTGQIIQGRAAIMATITQTLSVTSPIKPIAIESFVELDEIICVEAPSLPASPRTARPMISMCS